LFITIRDLLEVLPDDPEEAEVEETELAPDLLGGVGTVSGFTVAFAFGFGVPVLFVAAFFIGLSFGGGVVWSSLSLLFSGLKILFVFNFLCALVSDCCLLDADGLEVVPLSAVDDFLLPPLLELLVPFTAFFEPAALLVFGVCFVCFVTGVNVADALGFAGGLRFVFGFGWDSSDSDE
jgi:hypothetical protein